MRWHLWLRRHFHRSPPFTPTHSAVFHPLSFLFLSSFSFMLNIFSDLFVVCILCVVLFSCVFLDYFELCFCCFSCSVISFLFFLLFSFLLLLSSFFSIGFSPLQQTRFFLSFCCVINLYRWSEGIGKNPTKDVSGDTGKKAPKPK